MTEQEFKETMEKYQKLADKMTKTLKGIKIDVNDSECLNSYKKFISTLKSLTDNFVKAVEKTRSEFNNQ